MSNDLAPAGNTLPANYDDIFNVENLAGDLTEGVGGGFGVISFRGSKWRIKYGGEETLVTNQDGEAKPSLEAVILKASRGISKIYYAKKYEEGDDSAPDCWSVDGVAPDPAATNKQSANCATCPNNVWGSRTTESGKKAKACADNRRLAVVPLEDIGNETFGGPMLLRVPAASLNDLSLFGNQMAKKGYPYNAIGTRIGFDPNASYPKLTFKAMRALTDEEKAQVAAHYQGDGIGRILSEAAEMAPAAPAAAPAAPAVKAVDTDFEQEPEPAKKAATKPGNGAAKPKAEAAPAPTPEPAKPVSDDQLDAELDGILDGLDDLE